jgi:precorrin-6Y C5,15-methyltransferase (decarboxylating)
MAKRAPKNRNEPPVDIVGMGMAANDLTPTHMALIKKSDLLVGGRRHLVPFKKRAGGETYEVTADLKSLVTVIQDARRAGKHVVVMASGDPLYFGIGSYLTRALGRANVRIHPNITSVAAAFARMGKPWHGVPVVSLHGRNQEDRLDIAVKSADRVAVFTDPTRSPQWIGAYLRQRGLDDLDIGVFECMGSDDEKVSWHTTESIAQKQFQGPNMVILQRRVKGADPKTPLHMGMPESAFEHEQGLITKAEIRAVALARLSLLPGQVMWDLGAGSGAVAIEASLLVPGGRIVAVEKEPARVEQMRINRNRFGIANLEIVEARLPDGLEQLPAPDRVFIGGGGRALEAILATVVQRLAADGIVVINTVLMDSFQTAVRCLRTHGMETDVVQIQVSRSQPLGDSQHLQAMNPVWIIRGNRPVK